MNTTKFSDAEVAITDMMQTMRKLTLAQMRKQLNYDFKRRPDRFKIIEGFFNDAKEQSR